MFTHPRQVANAFPDKPALIIKGASSIQTVSYAQLVRCADQVAEFMASRGVEEGDTVAILLKNCAQFVEICWAATNSGLHYTAVSTHLNRADTRYILENSEAKLLFTTKAEIERAGLAASDLRDLTVVILGTGAGKHVDYATAFDKPPGEPPKRRRGASMLYSSGTTGRPKGVRSVLGPAAETPPERHALLTENLQFSRGMTLLNPGPFYHAAGLRMMMSAHRVGGAVIGFPSFEAEQVLAAIDEFKTTHTFFVPTMFHRMLQTSIELKNSFDYSSLRYVIHGAAPCPPTVKEAMIDWWGPVLFEIYGGTESIGQTSISSQEWLKHKGSVGRAGPGVEIKIVTSDGTEAPPHEQGLVYMKNNRPFAYHGDPEKTRMAQHADGYATLGDIGYLDADGYLYLTDRAAHMIISGGVNIYPQEAETALSSHPFIKDVAVIGVPHDDMGEEAKAIIVLHGGVQASPVTARELIDYCRDRLSPIKCPRSIDFVTELPRNESGKLLKREIRKQYWPA